MKEFSKREICLKTKLGLHKREMDLSALKDRAVKREKI